MTKFIEDCLETRRALWYNIGCLGKNNMENGGY